jgi:pimeloyl-ACP methyl ester carboxylesterase
MRARYPDIEGYVERDGVKVGYEVFGEGNQPTLLLLPAWSIVHSRLWKMQVPYLSRHYRVVTFDGRGNGRSDRPDTAAAYADDEYEADAVEVLDATGTASAVVVGMSSGGRWGLQLAARHPGRVRGAVLICPTQPLGETLPERVVMEWFDEELDTDEFWAKYNRHYWARDYRGFVEFFMSQLFTEPHSTKPIEDAVGWGLETDAPTLTLTHEAPALEDPEETRALAAAVRCPCLVIHGTQDHIVSFTKGEQLHAALGERSTFVTLEGAGHGPQVRDPVKVNLLIREFVDRLCPPAPGARTWVRGRSRGKRALFISSPIGLGHARRDVAIADELRNLHPDLEIDWLAQYPVTRVLEERGERIHPASAALSSEVDHIDSESAEHDLHCFQAWRRMDEILLANFMVFHDIVRESDYDLWIGDEAWELDYYLHENPEQKRAAYVWLTDFVGWLPMPDGGEREAFLTADYNAEMIEHIARLPRIRDRAVFVGAPGDIVPDSFGPGLPAIRDWTEEHYAFTGDYITGFDPGEFVDRAALRDELGYAPDERVCLVTVGGSGVGTSLLRRVVAAYPEAADLVPGLRLVVVAGPRIDPASIPAAEGLEVRAYVPDLYRHLAAADLAVVQGGLTTSMELTANRRPFLFFPLQHHFEQNFHVPHRLARYGAGRRMTYADSPPEVIAAAIAEELGRQVDTLPVDSPAATATAAELIAELV